MKNLILILTLFLLSINTCYCQKFVCNDQQNIIEADKTTIDGNNVFYIVLDSSLDNRVMSFIVDKDTKTFNYTSHKVDHDLKVHYQNQVGEVKILSSRDSTYMIKIDFSYFFTKPVFIMGAKDSD